MKPCKVCNHPIENHRFVMLLPRARKSGTTIKCTGCEGPEGNGCEEDCTNFIEQERNQ